MRNLAQYPITIEEMIETLEMFRLETIKQVAERQSVGDITPIVLKKIIDILRESL